MPALKLDIHQTAARSLYEQRCLYLKAPLITGHLLHITELDMMRHIEVLRHCQNSWPKVQTPADVFVQAIGQPATQRDSTWLTSLLQEPGPLQEAAIDALCWQPDLLATADLVELYQQRAGLRSQLFDLWRHRRDQIPAGLTSAAELRSQNIELQTRALRYAASRKEIGQELFIPYFRDLNNVTAERQISGKLLATALWGSLLRGTGHLYEPLWRGIEREREPDALYRLLRIGALLATPQLPDVIRQYAKEQPAKAAELLALHGTKSAIDTLADLSPPPDVETDFQAAWLWISGEYLHVEPRLQLVGKQESTPVTSAQNWWKQQRATLEGEQRLLFGLPLSLERVRTLACQWAGRYSINLLDLLAYLQKQPVTATERIPLRTKQQLLTKSGGLT